MMSKIENGSISPSLATLSALAKALNAPIASCSGERRTARLLLRQGRHGGENRAARDQSRTSLRPASPRLRGEVAVEPYLITLKGDAVPYTDFRHTTVKLVLLC